MKSVLRVLASGMLLAVMMFAQQPSSNPQPSSPYAQPKTAGANAPTSSAPPSSPANLPQQPAAAPADNSQMDGDMGVGVGDLLKISVMGAPEYDQELRVGADGNISLALVGPVHLAGLSTEQAAQLIRKRLMDGGFFS